MTRYAVALGSNLGDRLAHLRQAMRALETVGRVEAVSSLYESAPVGGPEQDPYLNAVALIESDSSPSRLLARLQAAEEEQGRVREARWGPRTLDLDLVAMSPGEADEPGLRIPHPRAARRRFVLAPLAEVWPEAEVGPGLSAVEALSRVADQEVDLLASDWVTTGPPPGRRWVRAQVVVFVLIIVFLVADAAPAWPVAPWPALAGLALLVIGLFLTLSSSLALGKAITALPEPRPGGELIESGAYAHARHPIYGGVILSSLGLSAIVGSLGAALLSLALVPFFWAKSNYEEQRLRIAYPGYRSYQRRVRRRLLPFLL